MASYVCYLSKGKSVCSRLHVHQLVRKFQANASRIAIELGSSAYSASPLPETPPRSNVLVMPQYTNLTPGSRFQGSEVRHFWPIFDAIGHHAWAAVAHKIANVRIWFWHMLMPGLDPMSTRFSLDRTSSLMPASVSDYRCRPMIDCLLYLCVPRLFLSSRVIGARAPRHPVLSLFLPFVVAHFSTAQ